MINMESRMRPDEYAHAQEVEDLCAIMIQDMFDVDSVRRSSSREDMYLHYDLIVNMSDGRELKVDVKGLKSLGHGRAKTGDYHWIELRNVSGAPGWLYGKADVISFQVGEQEFLHVYRSALKGFIDGVLEGIEDKKPYRTDPLDNPQMHCRNRIFTRHNPEVPDNIRRHDQIILVETDHLRKLAVLQPFSL